MKKLVFTYGVMGSTKTTSMLVRKYDFENREKKTVLLLKPECDTRDLDNEGNIIARSRIGASSKCTAFSENDNLIKMFLDEDAKNKIDILMVDECQFITNAQAKQLRKLTEIVPVYAYGLLTNFRQEFFKSSEYLFAVADEKIELFTPCKCGEKATVNTRRINGFVTTEGEEVVIEGKDNIIYESMCYSCLNNELIKTKINKNQKVYSLKNNLKEFSQSNFDDENF